MPRRGQPIGKPEDMPSIARKGFGISDEEGQAIDNDEEFQRRYDAMYGPVKKAEPRKEDAQDEQT